MPKDAESKVLPPPPYIPFSTFRTFIEALQNTTIPPRIDGTVTPTMSGQMRGALASCLTFLGLIDEDKNVTLALKPLVDAFGTPDWRSVLSEVLVPAYERIIATLDIHRATSGQLIEHFRGMGRVDGQVLEKAIRFYLAGLDDAGVEYSPHFKTRGARAVRKKPTTPPKTKHHDEHLDNGGSDEFLDDSPIGEDVVRFVVPFPDKPWARLWVPRDLSLADWDMIDAIGRAYVKRTNTLKTETANA